jgi:hypothetical protein
MDYQPLSFSLGAVLSLAALVALGVLWRNSDHEAI